MGVILGNSSTIRRDQFGSRSSRAIQYAVDSSSIVAVGDDMCRRRIAVAGTHWQEAHLDQYGGGFRRPGACDRCDWLPGHGNGLKKQTTSEKGRRRNQWARAHE